MQMAMVLMCCWSCVISWILCQERLHVLLRTVHGTRCQNGRLTSLFDPSTSTKQNYSNFDHNDLPQLLHLHHFAYQFLSLDKSLSLEYDLGIFIFVFEELKKSFIKKSLC